ncbi:class D sortase [Thalassobacillus devorans]|uniref:class D sortase n=1 Tax=Thalassobacillus devorans TaxID=279813 RepID=UPI0020CB5021|nr:class D sortase [Thalassobacillus devorans]
MIRKFAMVLFVSGFIIFAYSGWQFYESRQSVEDIPQDTEAGTPDEPVDSIETGSVDPVTPSIDPSTLNYNIDKGEKVAALDIPGIGKRFSTFWGTDDQTLGQGVGMYVSEWTTVPNREGGHTVLSGHRDTVFTGLGELGEGDTLELQYDGETYTYAIEKTWITDADDRSVIVEKDEPTLTLTTCYPFDYIGYAPDRYIVEAKLIE